jgi:predicted dehydrogenase
LKKLNVAIIGTGFMGKAHSNAWRQAPKFFQMGITPVTKVACDTAVECTSTFADNWGWEDIETDWRQVVERKDVDIIDICTPTWLHQEIAVACPE